MRWRSTFGYKIQTLYTLAKNFSSLSNPSWYKTRKLSNERQGRGRWPLDCTRHEESRRIGFPVVSGIFSSMRSNWYEAVRLMTFDQLSMLSRLMRYLSYSRSPLHSLIQRWNTQDILRLLSQRLNGLGRHSRSWNVFCWATTLNFTQQRWLMSNELSCLPSKC